MACNEAFWGLLMVGQVGQLLPAADTPAGTGLALRLGSGQRSRERSKRGADRGEGERPRRGLGTEPAGGLGDWGDWGDWTGGGGLWTACSQSDAGEILMRVLGPIWDLEWSVRA